MAAEDNLKTVQETFLQEKKCDDSEETVIHQDSLPFYLGKPPAVKNKTRKKAVTPPASQSTSEASYPLNKQPAEKNKTSPETQVNEHVQQAEKPSETTSCEHVDVEKPSQNTRMKTLLQLVKKKQPRIKQLLQEICRIDGRLMRLVLPELVKILSELLKDLEREFVPIKHEIEATVAVREELSPADRNQLRRIIRSYSAVSFENLFSIESDEKGGLKYNSNIMKLNEATTKFGESCIEREKCVCGK